MFSLLIASVLVVSSWALLFPFGDGENPGPEMLALCPVPSAPAYGSMKCDYSLFELKCTATCNAGFAFGSGPATATLECDLFNGWSAPAFPACSRGGSIPVTQRPNVGVGCVKDINDCLGRDAGDYQFCGDCRRFATCSSSGFYVRDCPGISFFDAVIDQCAEKSRTCSLA